MVSQKSFAADTKQHKPQFRFRPVPRPSKQHLTCAFLCFLLAHTVSAVYAPIQDCDEVFNFWEPTHYLNHGYGKQTWEFSPVYAIRSWLYAAIHALAIAPVTSLSYVFSKSLEFYYLRFILGLVCAVSETRLYQEVARTISNKAAVVFLIVSVSSAGNFHASTAYLPSSFAMYTMSFAMADFMVMPWRSRLAQGLKWLAVGTVLGWPFVAILCVPFVLEGGLSLLLGYADALSLGVHIFNAACNSLLLLVIEVIVDSVFYKRLVCVPLNILMYNIFSGSEKGPEIYGTEPWHFYMRNLLINYNIWFILALATIPVLCLYQLFARRSGTRHEPVHALIVASPFCLWLAILTLQPHKEERFMYPVYPCIALNAALTLHILTLCFETKKAGMLISRLSSVGLVLLLVTGAALGFLRSAGLATAYTAPLQVYQGLFDEPPSLRSQDTMTLCLGKEWYRFPSSYHLPNNVRLEFIPSEFRGLLPGSFSERRQGSDPFYLFSGASVVPSGMNDLNIEDPGKYFSLSQCDYVVDVQFFDAEFQDDLASPREPDFIEESLPLEHPPVLACGNGLDDALAKTPKELYWDPSRSMVRLQCEKFLDTAESGLVGRLLWTPDFSWLPESFRRRWGKYCLLRYLPTDQIVDEVKAPPKTPGRRTIQKGAYHVRGEL